MGMDEYMAPDTGQMSLAAAYLPCLLTAKGGQHAMQSHMGVTLENRTNNQRLWEAGSIVSRG